MTEERDILEHFKKILTTEPEDGYPHTGVMIDLTPEELKEILAVCYQRLRTVNPAHVGMLAYHMTNDQFAPLSTLTFCLDEDGELVLVDAQHRLEAALVADWTERWFVRCLRTPQYTPRQTYTLLDTSQKERGPAVIGKALGLQSLSERLEKRIVSSSRYQCSWSTEYENPPLCRVPPYQDCNNRATKMLHAYEVVDTIITHPDVRANIRNRLISPIILAVVSETIYQMEDEAKEFWMAVATQKTGVAADLHDLLIDVPPNRSSRFYAARLAGHAWNQRNSTGTLRRENRNPLKVVHTSLVIPA